MSRTVVDLREDLVRKARRKTGIKKKVEIVNLALEELVRRRDILKIFNFVGEVKWEGDLKAMRRDRKFDFNR